MSLKCLRSQRHNGWRETTSAQVQGRLRSAHMQNLPPNRYIPRMLQPRYTIPQGSKYTTVFFQHQWTLCSPILAVCDFLLESAHALFSFLSFNCQNLLRITSVQSLYMLKVLLTYFELERKLAILLSTKLVEGLNWPSAQVFVSQ